jgi:sugar phosphate isomerase/epimerase
MKLGVLTVLFSDQPLEKVLDMVAEAGCQCVELGCGNYPGSAHCNPDELLADEDKIKQLKDLVASKGLEISALSCHGNPLHPNEAIANENIEVMKKAVQLAPKLGVDVVVNFSGCPGGGPDDKTPNWVTCPWPPDFSEIVKWQWEEKVIPHWTEMAKFCQDNGINKIGFEMHPGFVVYNPESLLKLRAAVGDIIGANFDPSHLWWQGIDPIKAVRALKGAIWHVHAKDTRIYPMNSEVNGVLDIKSYTDEASRSWIFRTVGYGHGADFWNDFVSTLRMGGYDGTLSIEHEDSLMSPMEGLQKAVAFLQGVIIKQAAGEAYWA